MIGHDDPHDLGPIARHPVSRIHEAAIILASGALIWVVIVGGTLLLLGVWP